MKYLRKTPQFIGKSLSRNSGVISTKLHNCFVHSYNWVEIDGVMYKKPCTLVIKLEDSVPVFGKLLEIYEVDSNFFFSLKLYNTRDFDHHYHCFVVRPSPTVITVNHKSLFSPMPHQIRTIPGSANHCVVPCYHLASNI